MACAMATELKAPKGWKTFTSPPVLKALALTVKRRIMLGTFVLSAGYFDAYYA